MLLPVLLPPAAAAAAAAAACRRCRRRLLPLVQGYDMNHAHCFCARANAPLAALEELMCHSGQRKLAPSCYTRIRF